MENNFILSLVIPTYNSERFIEPLLSKLILLKNRKDVEVIFVDASNKDNTYSILSAFISGAPNFSLFNLKHNDVSEQRNLGITSSKGEYISFIDSDDLISDDYCDVLIKEIKANNSDIIIFDFDHIVDERVIKHERYENKIVSNDRGYFFELLYHSKYAFNLSAVWAKVFKKELINSVRFVGSFFEDTEFTFEALLKAKTLHIIDKKLYFYISKSYVKSLSTFSSERNDLRFYQELNHYKKLRKLRFPTSIFALENAYNSLLRFKRDDGDFKRYKKVFIKETKFDFRFKVFLRRVYLFSNNK